MVTNNSRSREGAWIEICSIYAADSKQLVAPVRERGLKSHCKSKTALRGVGRSREGAWIEITSVRAAIGLVSVAPVRERGLKWGKKSAHKAVA